MVVQKDTMTGLYLVPMTKNQLNDLHDSLECRDEHGNLENDKDDYKLYQNLILAKSMYSI